MQLSLVSGRPISFTMNLYQPLYITRPVEELELYASLRPQTYSESRAGLFGGAVASPAPAAAQAAKRSRDGYARQLDAQRDMTINNATAPEFNITPTTEPMDASASVQSIASASTVGELFQYTIPNATLGRQKSAMLPIVTDDIEVEKVSIYNPAVLPRNPLNGARVKNTTGKYLLQGPITVLDDNTYAGDAKVNNIPPGQERLISYAIDAKMLIDASKNDQAEQVQSGKIVKGVLEVTRKYQMSRKYEAENKSEKDRVLIIEHAFRDGWTLYETDKPGGKTDKLYRFRRPIAAGKSDTFFVKEESVATQRLEILPMGIDAIAFYQKVGEISPKVKEALAKAAELKRAAESAQQHAAELQGQLGRSLQRPDAYPREHEDDRQEQPALQPAHDQAERRGNEDRAASNADRRDDEKGPDAAGGTGEVSNRFKRRLVRVGKLGVPRSCIQGRAGVAAARP